MTGRINRTGIVSAEEAREILDLCQAGGEYSLGSSVARLATTVIVLNVQMDFMKTNRETTQ